jgi:alpha-ketoglutarate-dependent taurine dioxygenase
MLKLDNICGVPISHQVEIGDDTACNWLVKNQKNIESVLNSNGVILLKGLKVLSSMKFSQMLKAAFNKELQEYTYRSTPRILLNNNIYTATEYHSDQVILQHNENAYSDKWPMRLGFVCMTPSNVGGETPIGDSRKIYSSIPNEIKEEFLAKKIKYIRNYGDIDLPWQEVFCTDSKEKVESFCSKRNIKLEWRGEKLRTEQINKAVQNHPVTGDPIWFNQAHLFHHSALPKDTEKSLLDILSPDELPRHVTFGDGSEIDIEYLKIIRDIFQSNLVKFKWEKGDLMLLDNMLWTHGRTAFQGTRKILVGMA